MAIMVWVLVSAVNWCAKLGLKFLVTVVPVSLTA